MSRPLSDAGEAVNTNVVITAKGRTGWSLAIVDVTFSYNAAPTGGRLLIKGLESGYSYDVDIANAGVQSLAWAEPGLEFDPNEDVQCTLFAAGAAVTGKLNIGVKYVKIG